MARNADNRGGVLGWLARGVGRTLGTAAGVKEAIRQDGRDALGPLARIAGQAAADQAGVAVDTAINGGAVALKVGTGVLFMAFPRLLPRIVINPEATEQHPYFLTDSVREAIVTPFKNPAIAATPEGLRLTPEAAVGIGIQLPTRVGKGDRPAIRVAKQVDNLEQRVKAARAAKDIMVLGHESVKFDPVLRIRNLFEQLNYADREAGVIVEALLQRAKPNDAITPFTEIPVPNTFATIRQPVHLDPMHEIKEPAISPQLEAKVKRAIQGNQDVLLAEEQLIDHASGRRNDARKAAMEDLMERAANGEKLPQRASDAIVRGFLAVAAEAISDPNHPYRGAVLHIFGEHLNHIHHNPIDLEAEAAANGAMRLGRRVITLNHRRTFFRKLDEDLEQLNSRLEVYGGNPKVAEILRDQIAVNYQIQTIFHEANKVQLMQHRNSHNGHN